MPPPTTPTPSSSSTPANSSGGTTSAIAVGVSVSIVAAIIIGATLYFFWRRRQGPSSERTISQRRRETVLKPNHPASQVTPFPSGAAPFTLRNDIPRLAHRPGENMRIATRRSDGGWDFSRPLNYTPTSTSFDGPSSPSSYFSTRKDKKYVGELNRGFFEADADGVPPPAYFPRSSLGSSS